MQSLYKAEIAGNVGDVARLAKEVRALLSLGAVEQRPSLTKDLFLSHNDPTTPPSTNDEPNTTTPEPEAITSGDWKGYFDGWTENPD